MTLSFAGGGTQTLGGNGQTTVTHETLDAVAAGWSIGGIPRLDVTAAGVLWVSGEGDSHVFGGTLSGPADEFGTLGYNSDGTYTVPDRRITSKAPRGAHRCKGSQPADRLGSAG